MKQIENYRTSGTILLGSAKRLQQHYTVNEFDRGFPAGLNEIGDGQRMVWLNIYDAIINLYLFDRLGDLEAFAKKLQLSGNPI